MRILIWGMMLFTSLHVYSATLPGFKGNLADKIHPSLKMALLKEEMISDTEFKMRTLYFVRVKRKRRISS